MGFSPGGRAVGGPVPGVGAKGRVWFCGGFTGQGMGIGCRAGGGGVGAMVDGVESGFSLQMRE